MVTKFLDHNHRELKQRRRRRQRERQKSNRFIIIYYLLFIIYYLLYLFIIYYIYLLFIIFIYLLFFFIFYYCLLFTRAAHFFVYFLAVVERLRYETSQFHAPALWGRRTQHKTFPIFFLNLDTVLSDSKNLP